MSLSFPLFLSQFCCIHTILHRQRTVSFCSPPTYVAPERSPYWYVHLRRGNDEIQLGLSHVTGDLHVTKAAGEDHNMLFPCVTGNRLRSSTNRDSLHNATSNQPRHQYSSTTTPKPPRPYRHHNSTLYTMAWRAGFQFVAATCCGLGKCRTDK